MSFLIDPPLLTAAGAAISRSVADPEQAQRSARATAGLFVAGAAAFYLNAPGTGVVARRFGDASGREFMLNSGVLGFDGSRAGLRTHLVAAALLATYPLWLALGRRLGRPRRHRRRHA